MGIGSDRSARVTGATIRDRSTRVTGAIMRDRSIRVGVAIIAAAALWGCARAGLPLGGPADTTPPEVVSSLPSAGSLLVQLSAVIEVDFSEEMERRSVEKAFSVTPDLEFRNLRWHGTTLEARPAAGFSDSTTYIVRVGEAAKDFHGVAMGAPFEFAFSTGEVIDDAWIGGRVILMGETVSGATIWACRHVPQPDSSGAYSRCGYEALTAEGGEFLIAHVRPSDEPYSILAFIDMDLDGLYVPGEETGGIFESGVLVSASGDSIGDLDLPLELPLVEEEPPHDATEGTE